MRDQFNREHDNRGRFTGNDDRGGRDSGRDAQTEFDVSGALCCMRMHA